MQSYIRQGKNKTPTTTINASQTLKDKHNENIGLNQSQNGSVEQRVSMIESNLSRVCLQQDALMPLLSVIELLPNIQKTESNLKNLNKKVEENENKYSKQEKIVDKKLKEVSSNSAQKADFKIAKQLEDVQAVVKDLENSFNNVYRWYEAKLKEESYLIQRSVDQKLERTKSDLQLEMRKGSRSTLEQSDFNDNTPTKDFQSFKQELLKEVADIIDMKIGDAFDNQFSELKQNHEHEIRNVYKEIGAIRSEIEFTTNYERKLKISQKVQKLDKSMDVTERKIKINIFEQESFIEDLDTFDKENTQRILYEIDSIEKEAGYIISSNDGQQVLEEEEIQKKLKELEFLYESQVNLKYQVAGTKKKYASEMKKIEEKFEIINQIKHKGTEFLNKNPNLQGEIEKSRVLEDKLNKIMSQISNSIEVCCSGLSKLQDKLVEAKMSIEGSCNQSTDRFINS